MDFSSTRQRSTVHKRLVFAGVALLHVLALLLWSPGPQARVERAERATTIVFVAPAATRAPPDVARPARTAPVQPQRHVAALPEAPAITLVAPAPPLPPEPAAPVWDPAPAAPTGADVLARARKDMAKIDRDVRKASLQMSVREFKLEATPLEKAIASAYAGHGDGNRVTEIVLPDGSRMSKVQIGKVVYCVQSVSNTMAGALGGPRTRITNCPT